MNSQISTLTSQKAREESAIQNLHAKNVEYQASFHDSLTTMNRLEQELSELLFYQKKILEEFEHVEQLTFGDASPMGKLNFHQAGLLEGRFLEKVQLKLLDQKRKQKKVLDIMKNNIREMKRKEREIEDQIEMERMKMQRLDSLMASNRASIEQRKVEIAAIQSKIKSTT